MVAWCVVCSPKGAVADVSIARLHYTAVCRFLDVNILRVVGVGVSVFLGGPPPKKSVILRSPLRAAFAAEPAVDAVRARTGSGPTTGGGGGG